MRAIHRSKRKLGWDNWSFAWVAYMLACKLDNMSNEG
jgi:hypothetical protein